MFPFSPGLLVVSGFLSTIGGTVAKSLFDGDGLDILGFGPEDDNAYAALIGVSFLAVAAGSYFILKAD
jgi:hypothetical protein